MEIETMSKVGGSYSHADSSVKKAEPVNVAPTEAMHEAAKVAQKVEAASHSSGKEEDGRGKKQREHQPSEATINDAVSSANRKMVRTRCDYSYHKETNRVSIKVFDADTDEVIREIPPEKSLDMLQKMWEMAGILVDERR